jgi:hypothetical protein
VLCIIAEGAGVEAHPTFKIGEATVIAAVGSQVRARHRIVADATQGTDVVTVPLQARVIHVKLVRPANAPEDAAGGPPSISVNFDRINTTSDMLSLTGGPLGAGEPGWSVVCGHLATPYLRCFNQTAVQVPLSSLEVDRPEVQDHHLVHTTNGKCAVSQAAGAVVNARVMCVCSGRCSLYHPPAADQGQHAGPCGRSYRSCGGYGNGSSARTLSLSRSGACQCRVVAGAARHGDRHHLL